MKKKAMVGAGVASLALAAMPMVTSFADETGIVDKFQVSLYDTCAFEKTASIGTQGEITDEYNVSIIPGSYASGFAGSVLTVTCNTPDTYEVTAQFSDLVMEGTDEAITYSNINPDGSNSVWTTTLGDAGEAPRNLTSGDTILSAEQADGGSSATVHYSVGAASDQATGSYSGKATYTLVSGF